MANLSREGLPVNYLQGLTILLTLNIFEREVFFSLSQYDCFASMVTPLEIFKKLFCHLQDDKILKRELGNFSFSLSTI